MHVVPINSTLYSRRSPVYQCFAGISEPLHKAYFLFCSFFFSMDVIIFQDFCPFGLAEEEVAFFLRASRPWLLGTFLLPCTSCRIAADRGATAALVGFLGIFLGALRGHAPWLGWFPRPCSSADVVQECPKGKASSK